MATIGNLPETRNCPLARGGFFTDQDSEEFVPVAALGNTVYEELFPDDMDPFSEYILIDTVRGHLQAGRRLGLRGTPMLVLEDRIVRGYVTAERLAGVSP